MSQSGGQAEKDGGDFDFNRVEKAVQVVSQMSGRLGHVYGLPEGRHLELYRSPEGQERRGLRPDTVQPLLRHDPFDQGGKSNAS